MTKYIFVTGGVVSGLGKGITAASLGRLLKARGLKVAAQKLDPYINVDPGTMSPYQHGEVYVTEDGAETDLDLGHYERFIDEDLNKFSNLTTGKVYWNVLNKERRGEYLGETIQVIPHITDEIKNFIYSVGHKTNADVVITEIGGTAGDIESQPFLEAIRQVSLEVGKENSLFIHVTLVPYLKSSGEHKSKPTQHSVKEMQGMGISPDIIVLRCDEPIDPSIFHKIALFCNVKPDCVIENMTIPVLYEAPIMLEKNNFSSVVCRELNLKTKEPDMAEWSRMVEKIRSRKKTVTIGLVGKYIKLHDAYLSVVEALNHAGYEHGTKVEINWIDSELITQENAAEMLKGCDGILVPGGFGNRGIEGMIYAAQYARESNVPYLGICSVCRLPSSSMPATCAASRMQTPVNSTSTASIRLSISCRTSPAPSIWAAHCASAATRARSRRARKWRAAMAFPILMNATATAMSSITITERRSQKQAWSSAAPRRTAGSLRPWKCRRTTSASACSSTRNSSPARIRRIRYSSALSAHHSIRGKRTHKRR